MSYIPGTHPVFVSHTRELEQLLYFVVDLQDKLKKRQMDHGEKYECLVKVRGKCQQLLLRMYEEKSEIMMMNDTDRRWVQLIVYFVKEVLLKEQVRAR